MANETQISGLAPLENAAAQLPGSYLAVDIPNPAYNPANPGGTKAFLTRKGAFGEVAALMAGQSLPTNGLRGTLKVVLYEVATAPGVVATTVTLDRIATALLCVGTPATVLLPAPYELILVKDATGPLTVAVDGSFQGPTTAARWMTPAEAFAAAEARFSPFTTQYFAGARVSHRVGGVLRLFSATVLLRRIDFANNLIPTPGTGSQWEEVAATIALPGPNLRPDGEKRVRLISTTSVGFTAGNATRDGLPASGLCLGTICITEFNDATDGTRWKGQVDVLRYDSAIRFPSTSGLQVFLDGNFTGPLLPAKWVLQGSEADLASNIPVLDPARTNYPFPFTVKHVIGSVTYYFGTTAAGGPFPAPTTSAGTANWRPEATPAPTTAETGATIRAKLGVTILSGSNTGDQDISGITTNATAISNEVTARTNADTALGTRIDSKQAALDYTAENTANKGAVSGYASLDTGGKVPAAQLPATTAYTLPVATATVLGGVKQGANVTIAADGTLSASAGVTSSDAVPEGSTNLYFTELRVRSTPVTAAADATALPANGAATTIQVLWNRALTILRSLGTAATRNAPATGNATGTDLVNGSDSRLGDSRTPTTHASTHISGGSDPIAAATTSASGLLSATDKTKLDGIAANAQIGTVTSVGLVVSGGLHIVSNSPVTGSGNLTLTLVNQAANAVLAGPASGAATAPTMRALVAADIPAIAQTGVTNLVTDLSNKLAKASNLSDLNNTLTANRNLGTAYNEDVTRPALAFTLTAADRGKVQQVTTGASTINVTLPAAASGLFFLLRKADTGTGLVACNGGSLGIQGHTLLIWSDGTAWFNRAFFGTFGADASLTITTAATLFLASLNGVDFGGKKLLTVAAGTAVADGANFGQVATRFNNRGTFAAGLNIVANDVVFFLGSFFVAGTTFTTTATFNPAEWQALTTIPAVPQKTGVLNFTEEAFYGTSQTSLNPIPINITGAKAGSAVKFTISAGGTVAFPTTSTAGSGSAAISVSIVRGSLIQNTATPQTIIMLYEGLAGATHIFTATVS